MDALRTAVLSSRFEAVVRSMMNTIFRTGRSGVLNSAHDFSCCVVTAGDELLVGAESLPIHMLSGPDLISRAIKRAHPELRRGDAFLHNSPYAGNSHAADHCLAVPVTDDNGRLRFLVVAKAHQADCGNSAPTTYMGAAKDVYEEGALLFDAFKVQADGRDNDDLIRMCRLRIRVPDQWWGDYLALIGAVRVGERRLLELAQDLGWEALDEFAEEWLDYSERRMDAALRRLPDGSLTLMTRHDPFPGAPDGVVIRATVQVEASAGRIQIDLRDNPDCLPNGLNLTESTARTAAMIGVYNSIATAVPANAGSLRRVSVLLRENCAVGIPVHPTSCSAATTNLADRVANVVQRAIAELADGAGMAECGPVIPASASVVSGRDPRDGNRPFVNQIFLALTGGAAGPQVDAWQTIGHVGAAGMLRRDSVEIAEQRHPLRVRELRMLPDTEGAGRTRGASSARAEFGPVGTSLSLAYGCDGTTSPALGARGGLCGGPPAHVKRGRDGRLVPLPAIGIVTLEDGETMIATTSGGGGYGSPMLRDTEVVRHDVQERWVTRARAREVYGVILDEALAVDADATAARRNTAGRSG